VALPPTEGTGVFAWHRDINAAPDPMSKAAAVSLQDAVPAIHSYTRLKAVIGKPDHARIDPPVNLKIKHLAAGPASKVTIGPVGDSA